MKNCVCHFTVEIERLFGPENELLHFSILSCPKLLFENLLLLNLEEMIRIMNSHVSSQAKRIKLYSLCCLTLKLFPTWHKN